MSEPEKKGSLPSEREMAGQFYVEICEALGVPRWDGVDFDFNIRGIMSLRNSAPWGIGCAACGGDKGFVFTMQGVSSGRKWERAELRCSRSDDTQDHALVTWLRQGGSDCPRSMKKFAARSM